MKKYSILSLLLIILFMSSCKYIFNYPRVIKRTDEVKNIKTIHFKNTYYPRERRSPLHKVSKHFYKEIRPNGTSTFFVYDVLELKLSASIISDTVYLITDDEIFPIKIQKQKIYTRTERTENTSTILDADSTEHTVVTGYDVQNWQIEKIKYQLHTPEIEAIKNARKVKFRYYSEPDMITVCIKDLYLIKLKQLIKKN